MKNIIEFISNFITEDVDIFRTSGEPNSIKMLLEWSAGGHNPNDRHHTYTQKQPKELDELRSMTYSEFRSLSESEFVDLVIPISRFFATFANYKANKFYKMIRGGEFDHEDKPKKRTRWTGDKSYFEDLVQLALEEFVKYYRGKNEEKFLTHNTVGPILMAVRGRVSMKDAAVARVPVAGIAANVQPHRAVNFISEPLDDYDIVDDPSETPDIDILRLVYDKAMRHPACPLNNIEREMLIDFYQNGLSMDSVRDKYAKGKQVGAVYKTLQRLRTRLHDFVKEYFKEELEGIRLEKFPFANRHHKNPIGQKASKPPRERGLVKKKKTDELNNLGLDWSDLL